MITPLRHIYNLQLYKWYFNRMYIIILNRIVPRKDI